MTTLAYLSQMSILFRTRISSSQFLARVATSPTVSTKLLPFRQTRCISANRHDESDINSQEHSERSFSSSSHSPSRPEDSSQQETLLSAFDAFIDEVEVETERKLASEEGNATSGRRKQDDAREAHLKRLEILSSLPSDLVVEPIRDKCPGCGSALQSETSDRPGYVPETVLQGLSAEKVIPREIDPEENEGPIPVLKKQKELVCQRCYRLTHYGKIESHLRVQARPRTAMPDKAKSETIDGTVHRRKRSNELSPASFRKSLERLRNLQAVIIYLVDIFDFHGTFIPSIRDIIGVKNPVIVAVNKVDLLPKNFKASRVESWINHECSAMGLRDVAGIHLVSSTKGTGVKNLLADALRLAKLRRSDLYVVGAANVGKSSFINQLIRMRRRDEVSRDAQTGKHTRRGQKPELKGAITTSVVPGTTLDVIRIRLGAKVSLFDTPGLIMSHQLTNHLDAEELRAVLPSKTVEHVTFRLGEGKALYIGGLARLEVLSGKPFFYTCFFAPTVKLHPGKIEGAGDFIRRHVGELITPPYSEDRFLTLGEWTCKSFTASGGSWKKASVDIVLSGLGWISVTGPGSVRLKIWVPKGVGVFTREPLMPFEVETGVSKYTGTTAVNKKQIRSATRRRKNAREE